MREIFSAAKWGSDSVKTVFLSFFLIHVDFTIVCVIQAHCRLKRRLLSSPSPHLGLLYVTSDSFFLSACYWRRLESARRAHRRPVDATNCQCLSLNSPNWQSGFHSARELLLLAPLLQCVYFSGRNDARPCVSAEPRGLKPPKVLTTHRFHLLPSL